MALSKKRKSKRLQDKKHLIYVTEIKCCLSDISKEFCKGMVQAHHLLKPYDGSRGMSLKAGDNNVVPLCQYHHSLLHDKYGNEDKFWRIFGLNEDFGRELAKKLWENKDE